MNQAEWEQLSDVRIAEAQFLLAGGHDAGAYYLAGYAVECRLKALIVKRLAGDPGIIFEVAGFQKEVWTHNFKNLLKYFDLEVDRLADCQANNDLLLAWQAVFEWKEQRRYDIPARVDAVRLIEAITDPKHGVLAWINKQF